MFKRISVFALLSLSIALFSGCNDTVSDPIIFVSPTIVGTYEVTYFGIVHNNAPNGRSLITDSLQKSDEFGIDSSGTITSKSQTSAATGKIVILGVADGTLEISTKLQMAGGEVEQSPSDKFQYTEYYSIKPTANRLSGYGAGRNRYTWDAATGQISGTPIDTPNALVEFFLTGSELTLKDTKLSTTGSVDTVLTIKAKKVSDAVTPLEKKLFWKFDAPIETKGMYDITLFATEIQGRIISNDCAAAIKEGFANIYNCTLANQATTFKGALAVNNDTSTFNMAQINAKIQMSGWTIKGDREYALKYMYFTYGSMPGLMAAKGLTLTFFDNATQLPSANHTYFPESTFKAKMSADNKTMTIETSVVGTERAPDASTTKIDMKTLIKATKTSSDYTVLPNALF